MYVVLVVVAAAVVAGWARGGSLHALSRLSLLGWPLVFAALVVQSVGAFAEPLGLPEPQLCYLLGMTASAVLLLVFVVRNRHLPGIGLVAAGFLLNAAVIVANGAMPVSRWAAVRAGVSVELLTSTDDAKHEVADRHTRLRPLSDVVPAPVPGSFGDKVLSPGDVVLIAGIGILVSNAMLRRERPGGSARMPARLTPTEG